MNRILLLTKVMVKGIGSGDLTGDSGTGKKRLKKFSMTMLLAFLGVYMGGLAVTFVHFTYGVLSPFDLDSLILSLAVSATSFIVFFFGIFYVISIYYFSKDVDKLLPLPVKPGEIIFAKFLSTLIYEYIIVLLFLLPAMITYGVLSKAGFMFFLYAVITSVIVPVAPLVYSSIIVMMIMRFTTLARNKDRYSLFAGILSLVLALGVNFGIQSLMTKTDGSELANIISGGAESITGIITGIFPGTWFSNYALSNPYAPESLLMILASAAVSAAFLLLLFWIGNLLYFKGVIGVSSSASSRKASAKSIKELTAGGDPFITYISKEFKILFRTPIFFMNNVLMNFLLPVFMILPFLFGGGQSPDGPPSLTMLKSMLSELVSGSDKGFAGYIMAGFFGLLVFTAGTNGITETAISREGSNAYFMKIIPMSYRKQLAAKVVTGVILSLSGAILITAAAAVLMSPPLWLLLLCIAVIPGAVLLPNVSGIIFDLYMPKIKWDNEQKAVKQNLNVVFGILGSMLLAAVIAVPVIALKPDFMLAVLYITVFPLILTVLCGFFVNRIATRCMLQLAA